MAATSKHTAKRARARGSRAPARSASRGRTSSTNRKKRATIKSPKKRKSASPNHKPNGDFAAGNSASPGRPPNPVCFPPLTRARLQELIYVEIHELDKDGHEVIRVERMPRIDAIVLKTCMQAQAGDSFARQTILERTEGKVTLPIAGLTDGADVTINIRAPRDEDDE